MIIAIFVRAPSTGDPNWRGRDKIVRVIGFLALALAHCTQDMSE